MNMNKLRRRQGDTVGLAEVTYLTAVFSRVVLLCLYLECTK